MVLEILKILIPSALVVLVVYLMIKKYFDFQTFNTKEDYKKKYREYIIPLRLQAYERMILYLERISAENIIVRVSRPGMTARQLQNALLESIRNEYEHNLSQQLYISNTAWELIKNARANIVHTINKSAENLSDESSAIDLAKKILEETLKQDKNPIQEAINFLKHEMQNVYF